MYIVRSNENKYFLEEKKKLSWHQISLSARHVHLVNWWNLSTIHLDKLGHLKRRRKQMSWNYTASLLIERMGNLCWRKCLRTTVSNDDETWQKMLYFPFTKTYIFTNVPESTTNRFKIWWQKKIVNGTAILNGYYKWSK